MKERLMVECFEFPDERFDGEIERRDCYLLA
jgi:hypothetical protein